MDDESWTRNEYGGFLPLELNSGKEFFEEYNQMLLRFNSVKASLAYLLDRISCKKIYVPYYYCPSTSDAIQRTGVDICYYHIDEGLIPIDITDEKESCVLLVDYFGVRSEQIDAFAKSFKYAEVVIDRAHSFYTEPIMGQHIHNVYSAKKFFGVPDGSYLISMNTVDLRQIPTEAYTYAGYLIRAYEEGTDAAYIMKKEADKILADNYNCMSKLAVGLLKNVDYEWVAERRGKNYRIFHDIFRNINGLELPDECIAYQYPLLIREKGLQIKRKLIEDKIFVSTLWSGENLLNNGNGFELDMSKHCIFLPIDQRYNESDIRYIARKVKVFMDEDS